MVPPTPIMRILWRNLVLCDRTGVHHTSGCRCDHGMLLVSILSQNNEKADEKTKLGTHDRVFLHTSFLAL